MTRHHSVLKFQRMRERGEQIAMLTAYDYPTAKFADESGIPLILVGDTLGMVVLGYDSTIPVTVEDMIHHGKAVVRGTEKAHVVVDMPAAGKPFVDSERMAPARNARRSFTSPLRR